MKKSTIFIAGVAMMALAGPLYAAGDSSQTTVSESMTGSAQVQSAEELKGMKVFSQAGENLGLIKSVNTDPETGQIKFITISKGGFAGIGGEEIAVPIKAFQIDQTYRRATLMVNESKLDNAPHQASMSDDEFQRNLEQYYGVAPAWKGESQQMGTDPSRSMDQMDQMDQHHPGMKTTPQSN